MLKFKALFKKRKWLILLILVILIFGVFYTVRAFSSKATATSYVTSTSQMGNISITISGSGQVSASDQVDIKAKVTGSLLSLNATIGQKVKSNALLGQIDAKDAYKSVRDAQTNLETSQLALNKLKQPADTLSLIQSESALKKAKDDLEKLGINKIKLP